MMYGFQMFYTVWGEKKISIFFWFVRNAGKWGHTNNIKIKKVTNYDLK